MTDRNGHWERETGTGSPGKVPPPPPPPPVKCAVCGRSSRIAGYLGSDVCSMACQWRAEGAAAERERIERELWPLAESARSEWMRERAHSIDEYERGYMNAMHQAIDIVNRKHTRREGELPTTEGDDE